MAKVLVTFRVMPVDVSTNLDNLEKEIKSAINPDRIVREPIAFGLTALNVSLLIEDAEGQMDSLEKKLRSINSVGGVEVVEITRTI